MEFTVSFLVSAVMLDSRLVALVLITVFAFEDKHIEGPVFVIRRLKEIQKGRVSKLLREDR